MAIQIAALALVAVVLWLQSRRDEKRDTQLADVLAVHATQVTDMLTAQAAERAAWAQERWELNTRLQAPEVMRGAPVGPPPGPASDEPEEIDITDESDMIGAVVDAQPVRADG